MIPLGKSIKRYFSFKEIAVVLLAIVISISAGVGVFLYLKKDVVINDNGKQVVVRTMKTTVKEVLEQNAISVSSYDYINVKLDSKLQKMKTNEIYIKRAVPVKIFADNKETTVMTYKDTVREVLDNSPVKLAASDKLDGVSLDDKITGDLLIKIIRVKEETVSEKIPIPFKVVTRDNDRLDKGVTKTVKEGKEGIQEKLYRVVFEDGKEVIRELVKDSIISNPVNKLVEAGTILNFKTSRGDTIRYKKVLDMRSTAYTASYADTGKKPGDPYFGITYTGIKAKKGVVAVDPKVIPLGTRLYIEFPGGTPAYGYAVAADIGGGVKGNIIDLYFDEEQVVRGWGMKKAKVYVLVN